MKKYKIISPIIGVVLSIIGIVFAIISLANDKSDDKGGSIALLVIVAALGVYFILMNVFGFIAAFKKDAKSDKVASLINNKDLENKYNTWKERYNEIKEVDI